MPRPDHHSRTSSPSQRQLRVGEEIRHLLSGILNEGHIRDKALAGVSITVTEVRVSPDLQSATVFCTPLGGEHVDEVINALDRARAFIRGRLGSRLALRYTPELRFKRDASFEEAERIGNLLKSPRVKRDIEPG